MLTFTSFSIIENNTSNLFSCYQKTKFKFTSFTIKEKTVTFRLELPMAAKIEIFSPLDLEVENVRPCTKYLYYYFPCFSPSPIVNDPLWGSVATLYMQIMDIRGKQYILIDYCHNLITCCYTVWHPTHYLLYCQTFLTLSENLFDIILPFTLSDSHLIYCIIA